MINMAKAYAHFCKNGFANCFRQVRNPNARASNSLGPAVFFLAPYGRSNLNGARSNAKLFETRLPGTSSAPKTEEATYTTNKKIK